MTGPVEYPDSWKRSNGRQSTPAPSEAIALAVDSYIASLSDDELRVLLERTRGRTFA